jgi:starch synthase (maltosyl-transferring)
MPQTQQGLPQSLTSAPHPLTNDVAPPLRGMKIYNLFPRLAGSFSAWQPHLERAATLGCNWVFVNPIQRCGQSGSLYSIADYFAINPTFVDDTATAGSAEDQIRHVIEQAQTLGLKMMIDLVINHCAFDSPLVTKHPEWFICDNQKRPQHPFCLEPDGRKVVWEDLAQFDHNNTKHSNELFAYCVKIVTFLAKLGFTGFRCDAAYQLPVAFWRRLIDQIHRDYPELVFVAETLGCSPEQTQATAAAGFDAIYNSAKWWDYHGDWLLEQYALTRTHAGSIGFPESHDTERLCHETNGHLEVIKQRYLFTALFSSHVMFPIGFEYGFRKRLHVVNTCKEDWEAPSIDLCDFIRAIHDIKDHCPVFAEEGVIRRYSHDNPAIVILHKCSDTGSQEGLLILNTDPYQQQSCFIQDIYQLLTTPQTLYDRSLEWAMDYLPTPFHFDLGPAMVRILVTECPASSDKRTTDRSL